MFPHEGKLVIVHHLSFTRKGILETNESIVPLIDQSKPTNDILGVGMYASLMGTFDIPTPINYLGLMSVGKFIVKFVNRTDPWVLPSRHEPQVPLYAVEVYYQVFFNATVDSIATPSSVLEELDEAYLLAWAENYTYSYDCLDMVFPLDKAILEAMIG